MDTPKPKKTKAGIDVPLAVRALRLLARREHSRLELARKLARYVDVENNADAEAEINRVLDDCERQGWLSEKRVVEQTLAVKRARFGTRRITHELREKGISDGALAGVLPELKDTEYESARAVWQRKFGKLPANARERGQQVRFLQGRGFDGDVIRKLLKGTLEDE